MHSTSLLGLLKEFRGQNLQNFVPSSLAYAFCRRPNLLKCELWFLPNNTASVIHWPGVISNVGHTFKQPNILPRTELMINSHYICKLHHFLDSS